MDISAVDLFCGAGGLTYGLEQAGVDVKVSVDFDNKCKHPIEENTGAKFRDANVRSLTRNPEPIERWLGFNPDVDIIAACAPCQPYSSMGHSKDSGTRDHDKWGLLGNVRKIVEAVEPEIVVTENVLQVRKDDVYDQFVESLEEMGYFVNSDENKKVHCPEYGIPQKRKRWVLMASKRGPIGLPEPTHTDESEYPTVRDRIDHLPAIEAGEVHASNDLHRSRSLSDLNIERIRNMEPGGDWRLWEEDDLGHLLADCHKEASGRSYKAPYSRMRPDEPAPTITTQFYNYGSGRFGHYDTDQDRALSLLEGAILQTFPEDYDFFDEWEDVGVKNLGRLIGNAVPPRLGELIGESIVAHVTHDSATGVAKAGDD